MADTRPATTADAPKRALTSLERSQIAHVQSIGALVHEAFDTLGTSPELAAAKARLDEAVVLAVKHVSR